MRSEGQQQMGQSVFPGRSAKRVGSLVCLLLSSPLFTVFSYNFPFPQKCPSQWKFSYICALCHCRCSNGRMERKVPQSQTNSNRIWPKCFAWIPASQKAKEKCLALCRVHSHGKPCSVSCGILGAPKQWAVFPGTYRHFRSLQTCHDSAWMTPVSLYKLKCEIAHVSFWYGKMALCAMLPFEGDSSLILISYLLLLKPKVTIFKSNYVRHM